MLHSRSLDLFATLAPVRRGLGLARVQRWGARGLGAGSLLGIVIVLLAQVRPVWFAVPAGIASAPAGALIGALLALRRWPDPLEAARLADRHFALQDRLTTAVEFQSSDHPLLVLQRTEAAEHLTGLRLAESVRGQIDRSESALAGAGVLILGALVLLGLPISLQGSVVASSPDQQRIQRAATSLPALRRQVESGLPPSIQHAPVVQTMHRTLTRLQQQLTRVRTRPAAFRAISTAQQSLRGAASSLSPTESSAATLLDRSLNDAGAQDAQTRGTASGQQASAARSLNRLSTNLQRLSASQRAQIDRALSAAAAASASSVLRSSLDRAAASLAHGDAGAASTALHEASSALNAGAMAANLRSRMSTATGRLDLLKDQIAGVSNENPGLPPAPGRSPRAGIAKQQGIPGAAEENTPAGRVGSSGQKSRAASGRGKGSGQGAGLPIDLARAAGPGRGESAQQDGYAGAGRGGMAGRGSGGGSGTSRSGGAGRFTTVYIRGREGNGPRRTEAAGNSALLPGGRLVPYQLVVAGYSRSAHLALDQAPLPPSLRAYVRSYFTALSR